MKTTIVGASIKDSIEKAKLRRDGLFGGGTDAFRLFDGAGDGVDGLFIDDFAGHWLVQTRDTVLPGALVEECGRECRSMWWKKLDEGKEPPRWLCGERVAGSFPVMEGGCRFLIDFEAGYSQGLFLDQRANRAEVRRRACRETEILNCFAYTCGFSVAAALGGATTTSVDLSTRYLDWGKRNFEANDLGTDDHAFRRGDVADWMKRFARKGRAFDGVILDPPTFSRNHRGKVFRVENDFGRLAALAAKVVKANGWILCCSNSRTFPAERLQGVLRAGLRQGGRRIREMRAKRMPPEYRDENYLKSYWIELA